MQVEFIRLDPRLGVDFPMPNYASNGCAGMDLIACLQEPLVVMPNDTHLIPSGIAIALEPLQVAKIFPRSGLGHKHGIILGNTVGIIDSDYRGQIFISIWNRSRDPYSINPGDRIAQLIIMPIYKPKWVEKTILPETDRNDGGFGSTGT